MLEAEISSIAASGTLLTADGEEVVPAGLAFLQAHDARVARELDLAAALVALGAGTVRIAPAGEPDRYGRTRAQIFLADGRWLQAELVSAGLAIARPEGTDAGCDEALMAREAEARKARTGLWADSKIPIKASDQSSLLAQTGLYGLIEGRIVSVGYGSRMAFLDFGRDFRTNFTVMVPNPLVPRLLEAGIAMESLAGRAVRVRGVIEENGGPAVRLAHPQQLELLAREE